MTTRTSREKGKDKLPKYPVSNEELILEARGHITYFKNMAPALELAIKKMKEDLALCEKNTAIWEKRLKELEGK